MADNETQKSSSIDDAIEKLRLRIKSHQSTSRITIIVGFSTSLVLLSIAFLHSSKALLSTFFGLARADGMLEKSMDRLQSTGLASRLDTEDRAEILRRISESQYFEEFLDQIRNIRNVLDRVSENNSANSPDDIYVFYIFCVLTVIVFGVTLGLYRYHLTEIAKTEHYEFGLMRIRIAANNFDKNGFLSEVRESLTHNAFDFPRGKDSKVESPLPGHPGFDIGTTLVNKMLEKFEFGHAKEKSGQPNKTP